MSSPEQNYLSLFAMRYPVVHGCPSWSICKKNYCKLITGEKIMQKEITIVMICKLITTVWIYKKITVNHICKLITDTKTCKLITSTNICEKITDLKNITSEH